MGDVYIVAWTEPLRSASHAPSTFYLTRAWLTNQSTLHFVVVFGCEWRQNCAVLPCGFLDYGSAVTAQNDESKGSFHSSYSRSLNVKTESRNSILSLDTFRYVRLMYLSQHKLCTRKIELALELKFYLDFHWVSRPWRRTLTNGSDVKYIFLRSPCDAVRLWRRVPVDLWRDHVRLGHLTSFSLASVRRYGHVNSVKSRLAWSTRTHESFEPFSRVVAGSADQRDHPGLQAEYRGDLAVRLNVYGTWWILRAEHASLAWLVQVPILPALHLSRRSSVGISDVSGDSVS